MFGGIFDLALYGTQQLGVMLGLGSETVLLVAYLISLHNKESNGAHDSFVRAVRLAQGAGLLLMIISGLGAVLFHFSSHTAAVLLAPAFLFKWVLIALLTALFFAERKVGRFRTLFEGFAGGSWYALFLVHVLAPVVTWPNLLLLYGLWLGVFGVIWGFFVLLMRPRQAKVSVAVKTKIVEQKSGRPGDGDPRTFEKQFLSKPKSPPILVGQVLAGQVKKIFTPVFTLVSKPSSPTVAPVQPVSTPAAVVLPPPPVVVVPPAPPPVPAPQPVRKSLPMHVTEPEALPVVQYKELEPPVRPGPVLAGQVLQVTPEPQPTPRPTQGSPEKESEGTDHSVLPGLRVMPQTVSEIHLHNRAPVVKFS